MGDRHNIFKRSYPEVLCSKHFPKILTKVSTRESRFYGL